MVKGEKKDQSGSKVHLSLYQMNLTSQYRSINGVVLAG